MWQLLKQVRHFMETVSPFPSGKHGWQKCSGIRHSYLGAILKPSRCDVCGIGFEKKYYTWTIEGKSNIYALTAIVK